jgi:hypothetical protein
MKSRPSHFLSARWIVLLLAFTLSTATGFAQNVGGFVHGKIQNFQQTSPAAPVVNAAQPFQFGSLITPGTATINGATLTFGGTSSPRTYDADGNGAFSILDTFTTQAQLDAAYQSGNFTVSIDTSAGTFSRSIFLFPFTYPTTPMLTVPAGNWQGGNIVLDPTVDYSVTWNSFANAQAADVIQLVIRNSAVNLAPFPATQTSFTLPAGSLEPNTIYTADLAFVRVAGAAAGDPDIGPGFATLAKDTSFTISTTGPTPTPTPSTTPIATPTPTPTPVATPTPTPSSTPPVSTPTPTPTPPIATPTPTPIASPTPTATSTPTATPGTLANISTRLRVLGGDNVLIGGMIATGTADKRVILRAIGPSLTGLGVPGALPDPTLELFQGSTLLMSNDDWQNSGQQAEIAASGFAPGDAAESAIIWDLIPGQGYTAIVRGKNGTTGVGVVEAYDLDHAPASKLGNISTRGFVDVDNNVMIAGLILGPGNGTSARILARALGPTLSDLGVPGALADPTIDLVNSSGTVVRSNNNWKDDPFQRAEIEAAGLAPSHDEEAALVETVAPGAYTAIVRGSNRTTGVGLVEVYHIP